MAQITPDKLAELRRRYTKGSRVKLIHMNDPYRPDLREGALGTVTAVDDLGTIHAVSYTHLDVYKRQASKS